MPLQRMMVYLIPILTDTPADTAIFELCQIWRGAGASRRVRLFTRTANRTDIMVILCESFRNQHGKSINECKQAYVWSNGSLDNLWYIHKQNCDTGLFVVVFFPMETFKQYPEISGWLKDPTSEVPIDRYSLEQLMFKIPVGYYFSLARYAA